jgi:putative FmdB family regulatory protein
MPVYEYTCRKCDHEFEELVSLTATQNPPCPECGSEEVDKKMSVFGSAGGACGSSGFS